MGQDVLHIGDADFDAKVLKSPLTTLVDFWAEWCGPCRAISPLVDEAAARYKGKLQVVKMNVDDNPVTPSNYAVRAIPTLLVIKSGQVVDQMVGMVSKAKLEEIIAKHV